MAMSGERVLPPPAPPDFITCDPSYGTGLSTVDCLLAASQIREGASQVSWLLSVQSADQQGNGDIIPKEYVHGQWIYHCFSAYRSLLMLRFIGSCVVSIQFSYYRGDQRGLLTYNAAPNDLSEVAARVVQQCVTLRRGLGGFATFGISNLISYTSQGYTPYNAFGFARSTVFLTISVQGFKSRRLFPGNTDPSIPALLSRNVKPGTQSGLRGPKNMFISPSDVWRAQAVSMTRGGNVKWFENSRLLSEAMTYQCDAALGAPSVVDCTQIEWNQVTPSSDTLAVGPGVTTFLHSNSCNLAISAAISLVLTWAQIRTALSALMNVCIQAPLQGSRGGRAFYTVPQQISRRKRRKRQGSELTGLNALPPNVNITIFEQRETWLNPTEELTSCTWEAVTRGAAVSTCYKA